MADKDTRALIRALERQGFTVRLARSGHYRATSPGGMTVTVPCSPGGGNRSDRAWLRKAGAVP
jgi:predicted RNA binding protein YcfA (HicA-like mRNA interferase family)